MTAVSKSRIVTDSVSTKCPWKADSKTFSPISWLGRDLITSSCPRFPPTMANPLAEDAQDFADPERRALSISVRGRMHMLLNANDWSRAHLTFRPCPSSFPPIYQSSEKLLGKFSSSTR